MPFNINNGSSSLIIITLMIIIMAVASIGFTLFVLKWDQRVATVQNESVNLTGISYNTEEFNSTRDTIHSLSRIMPNLIWLMMIFGLLVLLAIYAIFMR